MNYTCTGNPDGPLVIAINGAGTGPWLWTEVSEALSAYKWVTFDLPGHGANSELDFTTIEATASEVLKILAAESPDGRGAVVGLSIGAQIAAYLYAHHRAVITHAVLISCLNRRSEFTAKWVGVAAALAIPLARYRWFAKAQSKTLRITDDLFEAYFKTSLSISRTTLENLLRANQLFELTPPLPEGSGIVIVVGEDEHRMLLNSARQLAQGFKCRGVIQFKGCGHGIPYENPTALTELLSRVFKNAPLETTSAYTWVPTP